MAKVKNPRVTNEYPRDGLGNYIHRTQAEKALGKPLPKGAQVHHVDGNKKNNDPSNLVICPDNAYHSLLHARQRVVDMGGHPTTHKYCSYHKTIHLKTDFSTNTSKCKKAHSEYRKLKGYKTAPYNWKDGLRQQYKRLRTGYSKGEVSWLK